MKPIVRRTWVSQAVAGGIAASSLMMQSRSSAAHLDESLSSIPIIDTHQHLWDLNRFTLPWHAGLKDSVLTRSYLPSDYAEATSKANVVQSVYMEVDVQPDQQNAEADYVLALCKQPKSQTTAAVISGRPGEAGFEQYVQRFAKEPLIKGFRQVLHAGTPAGYCTSPQFVKSIRLLGEMNKSFDLCMKPGELMDAVQLVDQCPKTKFILDHCGNGPIKSNDEELIAKWRKGIVEIAKRPNVICKISGIVASAPENWSSSDLAPVINHCIDTFGEDRIMFAGDWPVCLLRATFQQWVDALKSIVKDRPTSLHKKLFHDNALKFYGLTLRT
jgi:L-fuconolactonase